MAELVIIAGHVFIPRLPTTALVYCECNFMAVSEGLSTNAQQTHNQHRANARQWP